MSNITVIGLGPGDIGFLSLQALEAMRQAPCVILRTQRHPAATALPDHRVKFTSCDDLYETHGAFEAVYRAIVERLLTQAEKHGNVVYAVPGDPTVAENTVRLLRERAADTGITLKIIPAIGALNLLIDALSIDPGDGLLIADARDPRLRSKLEAPLPENPVDYHGSEAINPGVPTIWFQVDTPLVASDLKILLLEHFPPDHEVTLLTALGVEGEEQISRLPLAELDRGHTITHLTSLFVPTLPWESARHTVNDIRAIMSLLRSERGCPWDRAQDMKSLRRTIIEEAYEVVEAIERDDPEAIADELGDLLLNIVFVANLGAEEGVFDFDDSVQALGEKLIRRHAHVFGDVQAETPSAVLKSWEQIKAGERKVPSEESALGDVPLALPALSRSQKLQKRAAAVGFDWRDFRGPLAKLHEELGELSQELGIPDTWEIPAILHDPLTANPDAAQRAEAAPHDRLVHEAGDLLFAAVNLCRFLHLDAEEVMREANARFTRRFHRVEQVARERGVNLSSLTLEEMDNIWLSIKGDD